MVLCIFHTSLHRYQMQIYSWAYVFQLAMPRSFSSFQMSSRRFSHSFRKSTQVTPAIKDYVTDKFGKALSKVGSRVTKCDVHLVYDKNPAIPEPNHVEVLPGHHFLIAFHILQAIFQPAAKCCASHPLEVFQSSVRQSWSSSFISQWVTFSGIHAFLFFSQELASCASL